MRASGRAVRPSSTAWIFRPPNSPRNRPRKRPYNSVSKAFFDRLNVKNYRYFFCDLGSRAGVRPAWPPACRLGRADRAFSKVGCLFSLSGALLGPWPGAVQASRPFKAVQPLRRYLAPEKALVTQFSGRWPREAAVGFWDARPAFEGHLCEAPANGKDPLSRPAMSRQVPLKVGSTVIYKRLQDNLDGNGRVVCRRQAGNTANERKKTYRA